MAAEPIAAMVAIDSLCAAEAIATPRLQIAQPTTARAAKSAAILGGEMSALDRMRMQQSTPQASVAAAASSPVVETLSPAASGVRIPSNACASLSASAPRLAVSPAIDTVRSDDFLASKRVRIGKTNFDRDWDRVSRESVSGVLRANFGGQTDTSIETIENVNRWVNHEISYVEDRDLFNQADYWAGARRTLSLRMGDCEDIALTKMQLLAAAGIRREDMFLTIVKDTVRNVDHALLVVRMEDRYVVLDNATDQVLDGASSHFYNPVLSFSEQNTWVHGY
ncbi:MAG: transglutaminase-like cysteine peptidase [Erythrobacter sp.]